MGAQPAGMGKGHLPTFWKCCKLLSVMPLLSRVPADEVFMHYFEKMSGSAPVSLDLPQCPWTPLVDFDQQCIGPPTSWP